MFEDFSKGLTLLDYCVVDDLYLGDLVNYHRSFLFRYLDFVYDVWLLNDWVHFWDIDNRLEVW